MPEPIKTYKVKTSYILGNSIILIFPLALTLVIWAEGATAQQNEWIGVFGFWLIAILITLAPFLMKLEISSNCIKNYFLGFNTNTFEPSNISVVSYGNLMHGGLGFGKGLNIRTKENKTYSIGERMYGKEVIGHAKRVLEKK